jgi:oligopeptidase A
MKYGTNRSLREKIYKAYVTRAPENGQIIDKILSLRFEKAGILGYKNYAEYALESRDAESEEDVLNFLWKLTKLSKNRAKNELKELENFAKKLDGIEKLESYDLSYYSEKMKKSRFNFDENETKPYFDSDKVLSGLFKTLFKLFGTEFVEVKTEVWHESVKVFDVYKDGEVKARLYLDLEARESKRGGAWMNDWQTHFVDSKSQKHLPVAFVVSNFSKPTKRFPSLLTHNDVVTLFHEIGHAIHHLFSKIDERGVSGVNGVAWDSIEFPSQFLENFAYEEAILSQFAFHYETGEQMPKELMRKIKSSKNFLSAMGMLRQLEFSIFDFKLHQKLYIGDEVQNLLDEIREKVAVINPPTYNKFQNGFSHIFAGGYSAGYYSYKWAEVFSADAFFECLGERGEFKKERAEGYLNNILEKGGSNTMSNLYKNWLNREPKVESLIKLYEID